MCKYCEGEFTGEIPIHSLTEDLPVSGIELIVSGGFLYVYCECGIHAVTEIHYCPMCGEKLD